MASPQTLKEANKAFESKDYTGAIEWYTKAIEQAPEAVDYYLKRSTSYQRLKDNENALKDAEHGIYLAYKRGKREQLGQGQLRRGIALLNLGQYANALFALDLAAQYDPKEKSTAIYKNKVVSLIDSSGPEHTSEPTIASIPDNQFTKKEPQEEHQKQPDASQSQQAPKPPAISGPDVRNARYEWYQDNEKVTFTLYVKNAPKDKTVVEIQANSLSIAFPLTNGSEYLLDLNPLYDSVVPERSSYEVMGTKIEVKLVKSHQGIRWKDIENPDELVEGTPIRSPSSPKMDESSNKTKPSYPSSAKGGAKDWDKLAKEIEQDEKANQEEPQDFFKMLYADADEDTKRAMMKSYVESNGTALSTNWTDVSKGKVETSPPEGLEEKKW